MNLLITPILNLEVGKDNVTGLARLRILALTTFLVNNTVDKCTFNLEGVVHITSIFKAVKIYTILFR